MHRWSRFAFGIPFTGKGPAILYQFVVLNELTLDVKRKEKKECRHTCIWSRILTWTF